MPKNDDEEDERFLTLIASRPEDLELRTVYADWLEERGEEDRAELLRLTVWQNRAMGGEVDFSYAQQARIYALESSIDRMWRHHAISPPVPLATRRDPVWLAAALGGVEERAALGANEAPPSLLEHGFVDETFLWGWPGVLLVRMALAAGRHAIDACVNADCTIDLPVRTIIDLLDRIELTATATRRGNAAEEAKRLAAEAEDELQNRLWPWPTQPKLIAKAQARQIAFVVAMTIGPYQGVGARDTSAPSRVAAALWKAADVRLALAWAQKGVARAHAAKKNAGAHARAAAQRAEKAEQDLLTLPVRREVYGEDVASFIAQLTHRRDRARAYAERAEGIASKIDSACPPAPSRAGALRELFTAIGLDLVTWIREQQQGFPDDNLILSAVGELKSDNYARAATVHYGIDGRPRITW